ncbi:MAG: AAA family ATPase [Chloroflexota bacterium]|nr:MAG: AAA family ATPase [Chloroflexota bacterium]
MNCTNCKSENRQSARYCRQCGFWLLPNCPFCNADLPPAAVYCDQCGRQVSGQVPGFNPVRSIPTTKLTIPSESSVQHSIPAKDASPGIPPKPVVEPAVAQNGEGQLHRYISEEMRSKLEAARASGEMAGERRIVTMMFCDVKGSTAAAENLDPEEWSEIINGAFEHMITPVFTYEGTVARLMGDGILAFFGAPFSHEDDPQRAVLAGLDIVSGIAPYREQIMKSWGIDLNVRVGINTGLVVVGAVGSDLRMEYTALGDAINLASRMEVTAEPGTVQIAQDTYKHVSHLFEFEPLGGIEVKGKSEPVQAFRVLGRKDGAGRSRGIEGLQVEMVGRETELRKLREVMADLNQGIGRIVCVLGEAGLGKSRLVSESYKDYQNLVGENGNWYETISLSYEYNHAYGLFQRLIQRVAGIAHDDAPQIVRKRLTELLESFPEERQSRANQVFEALFAIESESVGPPLDDETFRQELLTAMDECWRAQFSARPTVLVFDDMHWSDAASIDLLNQLLPLTGEIPLVLICAMREERSSPAWQIKTAADDKFRHRYSEILLRPLTDAESNELVNRLLAIPQIPDHLRSNILEKSGGNPFFIEEVVRTLIDNGAVESEERSVGGDTRRYWVATNEAAEFSIPDNLQSLLSARMDRLEDGTRSTLQLASVIGRSFYHRVLEAVDQNGPELDKHVNTLLQLDMIRESARVPEVEYMFRNPLTQEAVYETILLKRRREFHLRVGEVMEELYPDRLEGLYGLLAHHFKLAGKPEKAAKYYRQASQQAVSVFAYEEAVENLRKALEIITPIDQPEEKMGLLEELGDVCRLVRDFNGAINFYQQAIELWESLDDRDAIVSIRLHRKIVQIATDAKWSVDANTFAGVNEISQDSLLSLAENLQLLESAPPHPETVLSLTALSVEAWRNEIPANWESAQRYAQAAVDMAELLDDPVLLSRSLGALANVLDGRSLLREHLQVALRRIEVSKDPSFADPHERIDVLRSAGLAMMYVGEYGQARPYLEEAEDYALRMQATDQIANTLGIQAQCLFREDRWDDVLAIEEKWRALEVNHKRERVGET